MNISLTLNFDNMSELETYLASRTGDKAVAAAPVAAVSPVTTPAITPPVAAAATGGDTDAESPTPAPAPVAATPPLTAVPTPTTAPDADIATTKTRIMDRLKAIAAGMPDQSELGKFITAFGVAKFSELPDDRLGQFEQLMNQTYPA